MKKQVQFILMVWIFFSLNACSAAPQSIPSTIPSATVQPLATETPGVTFTPSPTATATPKPIAPGDILSESLNPYGDIELADGWSMDYAEIYYVPQQQTIRYTLKYKSVNSAEETVNVLTRIVDDPSMLDMDEINRILQSERRVEFNLTVNTVDSEIALQLKEDNESIDIYLECLLGQSDIPVYTPLLAANFNEAVIPFSSESLFDETPAAYKLTYNISMPSLQAMRSYDLPDDLHTSYITYFTSDEFLQWMSKNALNPAFLFKNGKIVADRNQLSIEIMLGQNDGRIWVSEQAASLDKNLADYTTPSVVEGSLAALGFGIRNENKEDDTLGYDDSDYDIYIMVTKKAWGGEENTIISNSDRYDKYHLIYYPDTQTYLVEIEEGDEKNISYYYHVGDETYAARDPNLDIEDMKLSVERITGKPFMEGNQSLIAYTTDYIAEQFNMTMDELFTAPEK